MSDKELAPIEVVDELALKPVNPNTKYSEFLDPNARAKENKQAYGSGVKHSKPYNSGKVPRRPDSDGNPI